MWRYLLLRLMGWRPAVVHRETFPYWLCGTMKHPAVHGGPDCTCQENA